ncbi:MAG TPA: hypothetical protein VLT79_08730 [Gemmatimonadales bacterium]|nr:hypothetical protein [Gemmatimonadales bacterium]
MKSPFILAAVIGMGACGTVFMTAHAPTESRGLKPGAKFRVVATIATGASENAIRVSAHVRDRLNAAGIPAVPSGGRWDSEREAVRDICERTDVLIDGVVFVEAIRLRLVDCENGMTAYAVSGETGSPGIDVLIDHLIAFLNEGPEGPGPSPGAERPVS